MTCATSSLVSLRVRPTGDAERPVEVDATIEALLAAAAPVAIGVSGGKDSCAAAIAVIEHLDAVGHTGPRLLVHADLGDPDPRLDIEWSDSIATCRRLSDHLGIQLVVVRRAAGGMVKRWQKRWANNRRRYAELRCMRIILPWSTPSMRFCTSELKSAPIAAGLKHRWPGQRIVSACGIRREEGNGRKKSPRTNAPTSAANKRLTHKRAGTIGVDWNPIAAWTEGDVFARCAARGFVMHEGYALGMQRISCRYCIMQGADDQRTSAAVVANQPVLHTLVALEIASTFGFQGSRWLADVAPELLSADEVIAVGAAKMMAARRIQIESVIPKHLLYSKGWPTIMPTNAEAQDIARVRREIGELLDIPVQYTDEASVVARFAQLMAENARREATKARKQPRKQRQRRSA